MTLFDFQKLPIYAIGLIVEFEPMYISSSYIGLYWQTIKGQFPETEDIEGSFSEEGSFLETTIQGVRFINPQKSTYIKIRNHGFAYIYKKNTEKDVSSLESLIDDFCHHLQKFQNWLLDITQEENLGINRYKFLLEYLLDDQLIGVKYSRS
jgi:hypothetical protein